MTGIVIDSLCKHFSRPDGQLIEVLKNVSLAIEKPELNAVVGTNGAGKTTLLKLVAGLMVPDSGTVTVNSKRPTAARVAYVWQDYRATLLPWLSVAENIAFPLRLRGETRRARREQAEQLLSEVPLGIKGSDRVFELSGGQQQLVSVMRGLVIQPDVLLLDEPFSALDQYARWNMAMLLQRLWLRHRIPTIFVSHDIDEALLLASRVLVLSKEKAAIGSTIDVTTHYPRSIQTLSTPEHEDRRRSVLDGLVKDGLVNAEEQVS